VKLLLLFLLVAVPITEISVIVAVGRQIGAFPTVGLLLLSAVGGAWILRREGAKAWRAFRATVAEGRPPAVEALDGVLVLTGGLLMMLPGFVSDVVGLVLVLPPTRRVVRGIVLLRLASRLPVGILGPLRVRSRRSPGMPADPRPGPAPGPDSPPSPPVLEGEVVERPDTQR
jgi:UPF0716 protein FxsA